MARILIIALLVLSGCNGGAGRHETVQIGDRTYELEVAAGEAAISKGMMGRASFPDGTGMLFLFPEPTIRSFWMGNCLIDIDVMFIDGRGRITAMHEMTVEPPRRAGESEFEYQQRMPHYSSVYPVRFAIELPRGSLDRIGLNTGDPIPLDLERLKRLSRTRTTP